MSNDLMASPQPVSLRHDQVHVWLASLGDAAAWAGPAGALLEPAESRRAGAFLNAARSRQFVGGRALLRQLLSLYLGVAPEAIRLGAASGGKPRLTGELAASGLHFNLSHSRGLVAIALAAGRCVGVDVEYCRADLDTDRLARRFFAPAELEQFLDLPVAQRAAAFYACWTRKEAYLKARGQGVAGGLRRFAVSLRPGEEPALLEGPGGTGPQPCWRLATVDCPPPYAGALCAEGTAWRLCLGTWDLGARAPRPGPLRV